MSTLPTETVIVLEATAPRLALARAAAGARRNVLTDRGAALARTGGAKVTLVDLAADRDRGLEVIAELRAAAPGVPVVALATEKDPDVILRAMRAGACEFVLLEQDGELERVLDGLLRHPSTPLARGQAIAVFGARGGIGATLLATNLAGQLAKGGSRVLLVDLDRQFGAVGTVLDLAPRFTIPDLVKNLHRLDHELLLGSLDKHESGLFVLAQPDALEDDGVAGSDVAAVLDHVLGDFDYVVCDGLRGFDEVSLAALDAAARVELVIQQDVVSLRNAKRVLEVLRRLGYDEQKLDLVLNRYQPRSPVDPSAIAENLGLAVQHTLANDWTTASRALEGGALLATVAPRSPLTLDIATLVRSVTGEALAERPSLLRSLFGRSPSTAPTESIGAAHVARRSTQSP